MGKARKLLFPPLKDCDEFEELCLDIWRCIWDDPNAQRNGRRGTRQNGVDFSGHRGPDNKLCGVQCKLKEDWENEKFTLAELKSEVEKAKKFIPPLSEYTIATTGKVSARLLEKARQISAENQASGYFSVNIVSWEEIRARLDDYPHVRDKYYGKYFSGLSEKGNHKTDDISILTRESPQPFVDQPRNIGNIPIEEPSGLALEYSFELKDIRSQINAGKPESAQYLLDQLKQRAWDFATPGIKCKILSLQASIHLQLQEQEKAGLSLIAGIEFCPDELKTIENVALGFFLLNEKTRCREYIDKILSKNPTSANAALLSLRLEEDVKDIEDCILEIPGYLENDPYIAYWVGERLYRKGKFSDSVAWLKIALRNATENEFAIESLIGAALLQQVINDPSSLRGIQLKPSHQGILEEAIEFFNSAWGRIIDPSLKKLNVGIISNRAQAKRLMRDWPNALADTNSALLLTPQNSELIAQKAIIQMQSGDDNAAINTLQAGDSASLPDDDRVLLVELLERQGKNDEMLRELDRVQEDRLSADQAQLFKTLKISFLLKSGKEKWSIASQLATENLREDPTNLRRSADFIMCARIMGKSDEAIVEYERIKEDLSDISDPVSIILLAEEAYLLHLYEIAISLFERIVDPTVESPLTQKLAISYFTSKRYLDALNVCEKIRDLYGPIKIYTQLQFDIKMIAGDVKGALGTCQEYLKKYPEDLDILLLRSLARERGEIEDDLSIYFPNSLKNRELSLEQVRKISFLLIRRDHPREALDLLYEARRNNPDEPRIHQEYLYLFFEVSKTEKEWLSPTRVSPGTSVTLKARGFDAISYTIEDRPDIKLSNKELSVQDDISQKLLGAAEKSKVTLEIDGVPRVYQIQNIRSKYVAAFHEILSEFHHQIPAKSGIKRISFKKRKGGGLTKKTRDQITEPAKQNYLHSGRNREIYLNNRLPLSAFYQISGLDIFTLWRIVTRDETWGGLHVPLQAGANLGGATIPDINTTIVIDPIALMTLFSLNLQTKIALVFPRLAVAQSTIDTLRAHLSELIRNEGSSKERMQYVPQYDVAIPVEIPEEEFEKILADTKKISEILSWVKANCEILPCFDKIKLSPDNFEFFEKMGWVSSDPILICKEHGFILYCDEEIVQGLARDISKCNCISTQTLLDILLKGEFINFDEWESLSLTLIDLHYSIRFDENFLLRVASRSDWTVDAPFLKVAHLLSMPRYDVDSLIALISSFIKKLWMDCPDAGKCGHLLFVVMNEFSMRRDAEALVTLFISVLQSMKGHPFYNQIISYLILWDKVYSNNSFERLLC